MTKFCSECKQEAEPVQRDFGVGSYEYWGAKGNHQKLRWVSECCDGELVSEKEVCHDD